MEERWFDEELSGCRLGDGRLDRRLHQLVERMEVGFGESIPLACQDWASTKAAYRFFSNERVSEEDILRGHFDATRRRFAASDGPILVLHDTTEFTYKRKRTEAVGFTTKVSSGKDKRGRERMHAVCGLLMHSSLAVTTDGLPLGIAAAKFWTRKKFKGTNALKRKINPTRVPIEGKESMRWLENLRQSTELLGDPARCVHICDREGDIWELFCLAREMDTHFVIRRFANRLAEDGSRTVEAIMTDEKVRGLHRVAVRDDKGRLGSTQVELSYRRMTVRPPIAKQKRYPTLMLTVLHAREPEEPVGRHTVPSRLIGHRLGVRLYDDRLELFLSGTRHLTLPRGRPSKTGTHVHIVNYRHVIHSLKRKPMALLNLVYRDALFPRDAYRRCFEAALERLTEREACRLAVTLLALAHEENCEAELAAEIDSILDEGRLPAPNDLKARFAPDPGKMPRIDVARTHLAGYGSLLSAGGAS